MDNLHGVLRTLKAERKTVPSDHVKVFREFLSHLDRATRKPARPPRKKPAARKTRR